LTQPHNMKIPLKTINRTIIRFNNSTTAIFPKECKSRCNKSNCTSMFIAALFLIAKLWKQLRCLATNVCVYIDTFIMDIYIWWMDIHTHTHTYIYIYLYIMKFYLAIKKNEILLFSCKWIGLNNIMLSEFIQVQEDACFLSYVEDRLQYNYKY
jgi:hypothetical protein